MNFLFVEQILWPKKHELYGLKSRQMTKKNFAEGIEAVLGGGRSQVNIKVRYKRYSMGYI